MMKAPLYISLAIALLVLASGCTGQATTETSKSIVAQNGDTVSVVYTGTFENGTVFDSNVDKALLEFSVGSGQMIKGFDSAVIGMKEGDVKNVTLPPNDAYGEHNTDAVVSVHVSYFTQRGIMPQEGMRIYVGSQPATIMKVLGSSAVVDFNHPLAGKTLVFMIKMLKIERE